jgi:hypothetical protein
MKGYRNGLGNGGAVEGSPVIADADNYEFRLTSLAFRMKGYRNGHGNGGAVEGAPVIANAEIMNEGSLR